MHDVFITEEMDNPCQWGVEGKVLNLNNEDRIARLRESNNGGTESLPDLGDWELVEVEGVGTAFQI